MYYIQGNEPNTLMPLKDEICWYLFLLSTSTLVYLNIGDAVAMLSYRTGVCYRNDIFSLKTITGGLVIAIAID